MGEAAVIWGLGLIALGLLLAIAEVFVPSGGLLGIGAGLCALAGVGVLFNYDLTWGFIGLGIVLVLGPSVIAFGLKIWPHTPMGRRIIGIPTEEEREAQEEAEKRRKAQEQSLIGQVGVVLTDLRPVGTVEVGGRRYDALSDTLYTPAGTRVKVIAHAGAQIKVRQVL